ncbi:MAG TPA: class I SAM-dependent methyltransferase [Rhodanobacteraceae bacterium]
MTSDHATYTHGHHASVLRSHNHRSVADSAAYLVPELKPGLHLLDVGAGPGTITVDLARRLVSGRVTALETNAAALDLSRQEAARQGVANIDFAVGNVEALDFADATFDIVHAHQVLQHVGDPVAALREMRRVCKPGGIVAARDADYAGFVWYPALPALDDWMRLYQAAARANGGEPNAGRRLMAWAREAGFTDVAPTSSTWCFATPELRAWWGGMWAERILKSRIADQLLESELATQADLERISQAWKQWAASPDGWLSLLHGEIICRV